MAKNHRIHLAIVIPVYNEGPVIKKVIDGLPKKIKDVDKTTVLAVNDGSTDSSVAQIKKTKAVLISLPINMGVGAATATGFEAARILDADIAVTMDGDGQHDPKDIQKIIAPILKNKADLVIGTRLVNSKGMPFYKKFGNNILNFFTYLFSGYFSTDSQSGFKAFSKKALLCLKFEALGYEFCSEIIIEVIKKRLKIKEVPIKVIYNSYSKKKGQSIFNGINVITKLALKKLRR